MPEINTDGLRRFVINDIVIRLSSKCFVVSYLFVARFFFIVRASSYLLLGCTRSEAGVEQLFDCLAIQTNVYGFDNEGQHGQQSVLLRHTHKPEKAQHPICASRSRRLSRTHAALGRPFQEGGRRYQGWKSPGVLKPLRISPMIRPELRISVVLT